MNVLVLASAHPSFRKGTAANIVLAALIEALGTLGHKASWATVGADDLPDAATVIHLESEGASYIGDFTDETEFYTLKRPISSFDALRRAFFPRPNDDFPRFREPERVVQRLRKCGADGAILFWDTWFEHLLPALQDLPMVVYGARPRHAAPLSRIEAMSGGKELMDRLRCPIQRRLLQHQATRHFERMRNLSELVNICAVDVAIYQKKGLDYEYVPNTWPDMFGPSWAEQRRQAEKERAVLGILGNISGVTQTGNLFGLRYLASHVLPLLEHGLNGLDWEINITGGGTLPNDLADAFVRPKVNVKGFVRDLDFEILANPIFLLLNNAGPYTGGYTRVIYAFSSGACLIAHRSLAESMPEVEHEQNALLGETPEDIAELVERACRDSNLLRTIGSRARNTYEQRYRPEQIARRLVGVIENAG